jgi:hypothetical protein
MAAREVGELGGSESSCSSGGHPVQATWLLFFLAQSLFMASIYGSSVSLVESISLMGRSECSGDIVEARRDPTVQATICFPKVHGHVAGGSVRGCPPSVRTRRESSCGFCGVPA